MGPRQPYGNLIQMPVRTFEQLEQSYKELRSRTSSVKLPQDSRQLRHLFSIRILDKLPIGLALLDKNFVLREQNRTYADYLRIYSPLGPDKALNTCYFDYMPGSKLQLENLFREARDQKITKTLYDYELWLTYETGKEPTYWDASLTPAFDKTDNSSGIVIFCLDVTQRFRALERARNAEKERAQLVRKLAETKSALKVMLDLKEETKKELEERFVVNVHDIVLPLIARLKNGGLKLQHREILDLIESTLFNITSNFAHKLNAPAFRLTPREILIASLIKAGKTTKEISDTLVISPSSIECHRANLRKKLGLKNQKINLESFLLSI
jgi:DNA-binding NarL/FixJ family response regulator